MATCDVLPALSTPYDTEDMLSPRSIPSSHETAMQFYCNGKYNYEDKCFDKPMQPAARSSISDNKSY